jgi:hypothetical protein
MCYLLPCGGTASSALFCRPVFRTYLYMQADLRSSIVLK